MAPGGVQHGAGAPALDKETKDIEMKGLGLSTEIVDHSMYEATVKRFRERNIVLPTFAQLAEPHLIPAEIRERLEGVDPDAADALNLFRVHWYNTPDRRGLAAVPPYVVLPKSLTGVDAKIVVVLGTFSPMINSHKVLAAYACLAPRVLTGEFDPTRHRAVWPSTGNYCRGGVAISKIMACRGVAILPEEMSKERFDWLDRWTDNPAEDIIRTTGCESNVKEIYDKCNELELDPKYKIFNQFSEFGNHLAHVLCTGKALAHVFEELQKRHGSLRLRAFTSATGSAGTIGAGDYLKEQYGTKVVAVEALECPTLLYNGFGGHNIQGIGDKHVPLIHNVMNTDMVAAISDQATDHLDLLFNTEVGQTFLRERRGVPGEVLEQLPYLGFSSICNVLAAIKAAKYLKLGADDVVCTVASDGANMYRTERAETLARDFGGNFDTIEASGVYGHHLQGVATDHFAELTLIDQERVFNLGYYTWVEQQGLSFEDFMVRKDQSFWKNLRALLPAWDRLIEKFNAEVAAGQ